MAESLVPEYQPKDVTAQAPQNPVSLGVALRAGGQVGEGLEKLGQGVGDLAVPFAERQGAEDAQQAVTRAPDGTPQVQGTGSIIFGRAGDDYAQAVQAGETARLHTMMQQDFADMATKYQANPQDFRQAAQSYLQNLTGQMTSPTMRGTVSNLGNQLATQHYGGLVEEKANADIKSAYSGIGSQIEAQKNELFALARQGGTGTADYQQAAQKLGALYDSLTGNPQFAKLGISPDTVQYERDNVNAQATAEATIGLVDRTFKGPGGKAAAQKQLEDGILNNPALNLSETQRGALYRQGLARIEYLSGENKAQVDASRIGVNMMVQALAKGTTLPDAVVDQQISQSEQLGDTESVQKLQAQRTAYRATHTMAGLNSGQRFGAIMGPMALTSVVNAIGGQESGNNPNIQTSIDGAAGQFQVTPGLFKQYAKPGETFDNKADLANVGQRAITDYFQKYNGDAQRVAVAWFSGPGNVAPPGSPTPWLRDAHDGNGKSVSSYVADVTKRLGGAAPPSANGNPFTPDQYAANPFLASAYVREIASDPGEQARYGRSLGAAIESGLKNGYMPSTDTLASFMQLSQQNPDKLGDQAARIGSFMKGAQAAKEAEAQGGTAARDVYAQAEKLAQGGSIMQQKLAEGFKSWMDHSDANLKADPFNEAAARGWIANPPDPLNFQNPQALADSIHQRGVAATIIASRTGTPASAFAPAEEAQVKNLVSNPSTPVETRLHMLGALTQNINDPGVLRETMRRLAGDRAAAPFVVAGDLTTKAPAVATGILQGQAALAAQKDLAPDQKNWAPELSSRLPLNDFQNTAARSALGASIQAYYAKLSADANDTSGIVNSARMDQAVHDVTGGVLTAGGSKVLAPWYGATQGDLDAALNKLTDADFANARTSNGSPFSAAGLKGGSHWFNRSPWRLMSAGDGKYRVVTGAPDRPVPLMDTTTSRPFVLDLGGGHNQVVAQAGAP